MPTALITGTSKGIGLEFAKQYADKGWDVIGTYRGKLSPALETFNAATERLTLVDCDLADLSAIDRMADAIGEKPIDVLISNAGLMGGGGGPTAQNGENIAGLDYDLFDLYMATNVRAPAKLAEKFLENIKASQQRKFVAISSGAGSFGMPPTLPGNYWYKASKAALNMVMRNIAADLKPFGVTVVLFHPGLVLTERLAPMRDKITKLPGQEKPFEPHDAVANMIATIERTTPDETGRFVKNDGSAMPW